MNPHQNLNSLEDLLRLPPPAIHGVSRYGPCPSPESVWNAVCGRLEAKAFGEVLDHATYCPTCSNEFLEARSLARELGEIRDLSPAAGSNPAEPPTLEAVSDGGAGDTDGGVLEQFPRGDRAKAHPKRRPLWLTLLPMAATLLFVVGGINYWQPLSPSGLSIEKSTSSLFENRGMRSVEEVRRGESEAVFDASELRSDRPQSSDTQDLVKAVTQDGETLPRDRFLLRWTGPEDARFGIRVLTLESVLYTDSDLKTTELLVPEQSLTEVTSGTTVLWQVDVTLPGGVPMSSTTFRVKLK